MEACSAIWSMFLRPRRTCIWRFTKHSMFRWRMRTRTTVCWMRSRNCAGCVRLASKMWTATGNGARWRCWSERRRSLFRLAEPEECDGDCDADAEPDRHKPRALGGTEGEDHAKDDGDEERDGHRDDEHFEEPGVVFAGAGFAWVNLVDVD